MTKDLSQDLNQEQSLPGQGEPQDEQRREAVETTQPTASSSVDESQVMDPRDLVYTSRIEGNLQEILSNPAVMPQTYLSEAHDQRADYYRDVDQSYISEPEYLEKSQMHTDGHQPED